jgi:carboxy-terminal domain RNA polymerase II polypeptide A small phosphatase
VEIEG